MDVISIVTSAVVSVVTVSKLVSNPVRALSLLVVCRKGGASRCFLLSVNSSFVAESGVQLRYKSW